MTRAYQIAAAWHRLIATAAAGLTDGFLADTDIGRRLHAAAQAEAVVDAMFAAVAAEVVA
jgi:hypothetical protein